MPPAGIDRGEDLGLVAPGQPGGGMMEVSQVEPEPDEVGAVIEARLDAGLVELLANPDLVGRRRGRPEQPRS